MTASNGVSKGDLLYALVQRLADLAADAEGEPRRVVPRLESDTALPHQLSVLVNDLAAAGSPAALATGAEAIHSTARILG